jgi:hypothetical protein
MSVYLTILDAARMAATLADPSLAPSYVQWDESPDVKHGDMHVILSVVSETEEDNDPSECVELVGDSLTTTLIQRALLSVDFRIESQRGRIGSQWGNVHPRHHLTFARAMKAAWRTAAVRALLTEGNVVLIADIGQTLNRSAERNGVTLAMASFELKFRAIVSELIDPTNGTVINTIVATGTVNGDGDEFETDGLQVTRP